MEIRYADYVGGFIELNKLLVCIRPQVNISGYFCHKAVINTEINMYHTPYTMEHDPKIKFIKRKQ